MNLTREELYELLKRHFNRDDFASGQIEVISKILSGNDVLGIKGHVADYNICYMYPALIIDGIVIVASKRANDHNPNSILTSVYINYPILSNHLQKRLAEIIDGKYKIIYVSPENFHNKAFIFALNKIPTSLIVIDDAQHVSRMRYDFNIDYTYIPNIIADMDTRPNILAFANDCKGEIQRDIIKQLQMEDNEPIKLGNSFPDVSFEVLSVKSNKEKLELLTKLIKSLNGQGIIFANNQKNVADIKNTLKNIKPDIEEYHSGITYDKRQKIEKDFIDKRLSSIILTNTSYPLITNSKVNYIIHADMPDKLERYYDHIINFGCSEQALRCVLLYSPFDREYHQSIIERGNVSLVDIWHIIDVLKALTPKNDIKRGKKREITLQRWLLEHHSKLMAKNQKELTRLKELHTNLNEHDKNPYSLTEYKKYLDSDHWQNFAKNVLKESPHCQVCNAKAEHIHHLHYRNIRNEKAEDVVALCQKCHAYIHPDNPMTVDVFNANVESEQRQIRLFENDEKESRQYVFIEHEQFGLESGLSRSRLISSLSEMQNAGMLEVLPDCALTANIEINVSKGEFLSYAENETSQMLIEWIIANQGLDKEFDVNLMNISNDISCSIDDIENAFLYLNHNKAVTFIPQKRCMAILLYDLDVGIIEKNIERLKGERYEFLKMMVNYAQTAKCRQGFISQNVLGETQKDCGKCDNCSASTPSRIEVTGTSNEALMEISEKDRALIEILNCTEKIDGLLSRRDMLKMLTGQKTKRIAKYGFDHVEEFGCLSDMPKGAILEKIDELLELRCLKITSLFFPMIQLTDAGRQRQKKIIAKVKSRNNKQFKGLSDLDKGS